MPDRDLILRLPRQRWRSMTRELARRGEGRRESGAFLLTSRKTQGHKMRVERYIFFDDLDPDCLDGAISLRGVAFAELWEICRRDGLRVVADVHTHPSHWVEQSSTDRANPMVAQAGHVGVILPRFAAGNPKPRHAGVHVYRGGSRWDSHFDKAAAHRLRLSWW